MTQPFDVRVEYDAHDKQWVAVFRRNNQVGVSEEWYLHGALVGMGQSPGLAVENLIGLATYIIEEGTNFLMQDEELPMADRAWLFQLLDGGLDPEENQRLWEALQKAERG